MENGAMGISDAENVRTRRKSNGKRRGGAFRCQKYQNQYLWKNLWNSAMKKVTISAKKCEENVKNCGQ